jgi:hypothetical protein
MPTATNGQPHRVRLPQQGRKPLLIVADDKRPPVMNLPWYLAWHRPTGYFYVGGTGMSWTKSNLKTRDRVRAIFRFRDARSGNFCHLFPDILATSLGVAFSPFVPPSAGVFSGMGGQ